ncbi:MAG: hypothetical protein DRP71_13545 [Verrucomicrobia bacterium]|nr:MAG: hypothetical protein DRP71_13545 [Verrucomicrobiota bacterium]
MNLKAGAAVLDITPHSPCHLAGYEDRDHPHEGVHDPLSVRALYLTNGSEELVLISADIIWFHEDIANPIHNLIKEQLGLAPERVMLCGTHTHSAPVPSRPGANSEYLHFLTSQVLAAVSVAKTRIEPVSLSIARGSSQVGVNRREQKPGGEVVLGYNEDGPIDREIILLSLAGADGRVQAEVCSFANHGVVLGPRNYLISGDWCGMAAAAVESERKEVFLFMNGGSANVNPRLRSGPQERFKPAEDLAAEFVHDLVAARETLVPPTGDDTLSGRFSTLELPLKVKAIEDGQGRTQRVRIHGIRIGPACIVGFPGEVFSETSIAVKETRAPDTVIVNSYTSGGSAGYVPVREAYDTGGYEVRVSPYSEGAEERLRQGFIDLIRNL